MGMGGCTCISTRVTFYNIEIWFDGDTIEIFVFCKLRSGPRQSIDRKVRIIEFFEPPIII